MISNAGPKLTRRHFSAVSLSTFLVGNMLQNDLQAVEDSGKPTDDKNLQGAIGLVSASAHVQTSGRAVGRNFTLLEMPQILKEELNLTVLDLNTMSFPSFDDVNAAYVDRLRSAVDKAGCVMTNLKMNQRGLHMNSPDRDTRQRAITEYKRSIDIAAELGCRWARPLPRKETPDHKRHISSYQELCDYAADKNVQLLVENFGWMQNDPDSVPNLVNAIGPQRGRLSGHRQLEQQRNSICRPDQRISSGRHLRLQSKETEPQRRTSGLRSQTLFRHRLDGWFPRPLGD